MSDKMDQCLWCGEVKERARERAREKETGGFRVSGAVSL